MADIGSLVVSLQARTDTLERQLARANGMIKKLQRETRGIGRASEDAQRRTTRAFTRMSLGVRGLNSRLIAVSRSMRALAIAGTAFLAGSFVTRTIQATDALGKFAERIGFSVESFQALEFAASQSGVSLQTFQLAAQRIIRRAQDAVAGNESLADSFADVGLSLQDLERLSNADIFRQAITGAAELETGLAAIQKIADTEGVALIQLGRQGAAGIAALEERARRLGLVLDQNLFQRAAAANDQLDIMTRTIRARLTVAIDKILPALTRFGNAFTRIVSAIVSGSNAVQGLTRNEAAITRMFLNFKNILDQIVPLLSKLLTLLEPVITALTNLQVLVLSQVNKGLEAFSGWLGEITNQAPKAKEAIGRITMDFDAADIRRQRRQSRFERSLERSTEGMAGTVMQEEQEKALRESEAFFKRTEMIRAAITDSVLGIGEAFGQAAIGVARGQQTMSQAFRNLTQSIAAFVLNSLVQRGIQLLLNLALSAVPGAGVAGAAGGAVTSSGILKAANGAVVTRPTLALLGERPSSNPEIVLNRQQFQNLSRQAAPNVTVINVASEDEAQRVAALEAAQGVDVQINRLADAVRRQGNGSPLVQSMRSVIGR